MQVSVEQVAGGGATRGRTYVVSRRDPGLRLTLHAAEIVFLLSRGSNAKEIAAQLGLAVHTVYEEISLTRKRLQARNLPELIRLAIWHGFIRP